MTRTGRRGFTLMELVVALAITGMAVSAGYAVLAMLADRRDVIAAEAATLARASAVRGSILEWLGGARVDVTRLTPSFRGQDRERDGAPDDELTFLTAAPTPIGAARTLVRLAIERDSSGRATGFIAEFRDWDGAATQRILLDSSVVSLDLRYHTRLTSTDGPVDSWTSASVLPVSLELRLAASQGSALPPLLAFPFFATIEGGR